MLPKFSLRALLVAKTMLAIALGMIANRLNERRRQERLLGEALEWSYLDGSRIFGRAEPLTLFLEAPNISEQTAEAIASAERVRSIVLCGKPTPGAEHLLENHFELRGTGELYEGLWRPIWDRKP